MTFLNQIVLALFQTLDSTTTVQKHYINDESRYQLVAVTQDQIVSLMNIEVGESKCFRIMNLISVPTSIHIIWVAAPPMYYIRNTFPFLLLSLFLGEKVLGYAMQWINTLTARQSSWLNEFSVVESFVFSSIFPVGVLLTTQTSTCYS